MANIITAVADMHAYAVGVSCIADHAPSKVVDVGAAPVSTPMPSNARVCVHICIMAAASGAQRVLAAR